MFCFNAFLEFISVYPSCLFQCVPCAFFPVLPPIPDTPTIIERKKQRSVELQWQVSENYTEPVLYVVEGRWNTGRTFSQTYATGWNQITLVSFFFISHTSNASCRKRWCISILENWYFLQRCARKHSIKNYSSGSSQLSFIIAWIQ